MIAEALKRLHTAASIPNPIQRVVSLSEVATSMSPGDRAKLIVVLTEGALHGPTSARSLAAQLGG